MKKIWILWGMWPQASLDFYRMLIEKSAKNMKYPRNQDYPHLLLANIPVPDLIAGKDDIAITLNMVNQEAQALERAWVEFIVMPCNTMHLFQKEITKGVNIPFISLIDCVLEKVREGWIQKLWLLWSSTTMQSDLYLSPLQKIWVELIVPERHMHDSISQSIHNYIAGKSSNNDTNMLETYCDDLLNNWAELIILWCTELPLILQSSFSKYPFLASSEILADRVLELHK